MISARGIGSILCCASPVTREPPVWLRKTSFARTESAPSSDERNPRTVAVGEVLFPNRNACTLEYAALRAATDHPRGAPLKAGEL
jgi:hypothetical protein